jgi:hypothetical protein
MQMLAVAQALSNRSGQPMKECVNAINYLWNSFNIQWEMIDRILK